MKAINLFSLAALAGIGLLITPAAKPADTEIANLTGCLAQGAKPHVYSLKDANGTTYGLLPDKGVAMKKHVGQEVVVAGWPIKAKREQRQAPEDQYLRVTQVKKSTAGTCTQ